MLRALLLADTHLGFDLPVRPRSDRARRGPDFFATTRRALAPALAGEVDLVVHGGDLLQRSKVPSGLVRAALEPLLEVADRGVPVLLVPGNHERSALPYPLLAAHRHLHLFDRPRTVRLRLRGLDIAIAGFPCERDRIAERFPSLLEACEAPSGADLRLLCLHQTVEGARVGPGNFTFGDGPDVLPGRLVPSGFAAVLAGHIHRCQVLKRDLSRRPLAAPVLYPGSVERTSFAERDEAKGYLILELEPDRTTGGRLAGWRFIELPTRPMRRVEIDPSDLSVPELAKTVAARLAAEPSDAVVQLRLLAAPAPEAGAALRVAALSRLHPPTMIVSVVWPRV